MAENKLWYATMRDADDTDWGYGSYDYGEAVKIVTGWRKSGEDAAYIAVIDESGSEPMCIREIKDF